MIPRYTLPEMGRIWSEENKLSNWLKIEIAACEAWAELGKIPADALADIKEKARFDVKRIQEIEAQVHHDVIAFTTNVAEYVGEASKYIHFGLTSSDVLDTGLALQMRGAADILLDKLQHLRGVVADKARQYKYTLNIGRTHGVHGEPSTFGLKMAMWYSELGRDIERLEQARKVIACGAISGAVGNFAHLDPRVEEYVCKTLELTPCAVSTQVIQRDRHAQFMTTLAVIASSIEKMATEIRNLQRTEILEAEEPFRSGQKGSSAMPHKRNPVLSENLSGLARLMRSYACAALEDVALWHERDISHSSVERVIAPDATILLDFMLDRFTGLMNKLLVYPERMIANLNMTRGLIFSQMVLLKLIEKGESRERAYALVQRNAMRSWQEGAEFMQLLQEDRDVMSLLSSSELSSIFETETFLKQVDFIFDRVFGG